MKIIKCYHNLELAKQYDVERIKKSESNTMKMKKSVIVENMLEVYINDMLVCKLVCSPNQMEELVLGYLFTEGIIENIDEVACIYICEFGTRAKVFLEGNFNQMKASKKSVEIISTSCMGNKVICGELMENKALKKLPAHSWDAEEVFFQSFAFYEGAELYVETRGAHSCSLSANREILYKCEDISRHNAVDKVIGCALRDHIDLKKVILFTSGRIPADMVIKVIRSGIPVLASHSVPTDQAIEIARQYNLTLLGSVKVNQMDVYMK